ncbi:MAG: MFS transporter [Sphingobium sp.]
MNAGRATPQDGPSGRTPPGVLLVMLVLVLAEVLSSFESSMVYTALPGIARDLGDLSTASWLITAHLLGSVVMAVIGGRLGDAYGRRRIILIAVLLCGIGSLVSAVASSTSLIIAGRALQGASGALLPLVFGIVREVVVPHKSPFWIGCMTGAFGVGSSMGFLLGGYLSDAGHWQSMFVFTSLYSLALLPILFAVLPRSAGAAVAGERFDYLGAILFAPGVALVLLAVSTGFRKDADLLWTAALLATGATLLAIWIGHELRCRHPLVHLRHLRNRSIALAFGGMCLASVGLVQTAFLFMLLMQQPSATGIGLGLSATLAGMLKIPSSLTAGIASPLSGWLSARYGSALVLAIGSGLGGLGWIALIGFHDTLWHVVAISMLCSFAAYVLMTGLPTLALEQTPVGRSSEVTGAIMMLRGVATAVGVQLMGIFLSISRVTLPSGDQHPAESAFLLAFAGIGTSALLLMAICWHEWRRRPSPMALSTV